MILFLKHKIFASSCSGQREKGTMRKMKDGFMKKEGVFFKKCYKIRVILLQCSLGKVIGATF